MRVVAIACLALAASSPAAAKPRWVSIFDGHDLKGWTPKINHHPAGENWRNTFVADHGVLKVNYAEYPSFSDEYGHLVYNRMLSHYRLRLEYRFTGPPTPGAQSWAWRNSGVMLHGQAAEAMALDQPYPIAVEAQLLGANAPGEVRPTVNVCTPGVTVSFDGVPMKEHCRNSTAPTVQDGEWVRLELEVDGGRRVRQIVNGRLVMEYGDLHTDPSEYKRFANVDPGDAQPAPLESGFLSLQAESSPLEFRRIQLMDLDQAKGGGGHGR